MKVKNIYFNDFINYGGHCSLTVAMPYCSFKCGKDLCQNSDLACAEAIEISDNYILDAFCKSDLMNAIVFQGLEPLDSWDELSSFLTKFREKSNSPVIIYTGYTQDEVSNDVINFLKEITNVIIKFGRFIPNQEPHYDPVLRVKLASNNQYAIEVDKL